MKSKFSLYAIVLLTLAIFLSGCATGVTPSSWPGVSSDGEKVYVASTAHIYAVQLSNGSESWRYPAKPDAKKTFFAPPILTEDGQLIAGGYNRVLYSLDPADGSENWTFTEAKDRYIGGILNTGELILAPNADFHLYALDLDGKLKWKFTADAELWAPPVVDGEKAYFGSLGHTVYAVNIKTGKLLWSKKVDGAILGSLSIGDKGNLFVSTQGKSVYALNQTDGEIKWQHPLSSWIWSGPIFADGIVYCGDQGGKFVALKAETGKEVWSLQPDGPILGSGLLIPEGILFGTESGSLVAVDSAGKTIWTQTITGKNYGTPILTGETILVAPVEGDATLVALDLKGTQQWVYTPAK